MAFCYQNAVYVVKYSTMSLTHFVEIPRHHEILDLAFVEGTNSLILFSKYRLDLIVLGS